jgi:hypothetical protein
MSFDLNCFLYETTSLHQARKDGPPSAFAGFLKFPLVAGYILGLVGGYLTVQKIRPSEVELLRSVIDVHTNYSANELDAEISTHFMMQQSTFKFGLDVGVLDVRRYLSEQAQTGKSQYILLAAASEIFLRHSDARTLKSNIAAFCNTHAIPLRDDRTLAEIVERWEVQKQYGMK